MSAAASVTPAAGEAAIAASSSDSSAPVSAENVAALRLERKNAKKVAQAAKKAARPPPEVHLKNVPMLLVTCDATKEPMAKKEMMAWMQDYADKHYPRDTTSASKGATSVSSGLEAELAALAAEARAERASSSTSAASAAAALGVRFKIVGDMAIFRGLFLVAVLDPTINIVTMVEGMLEEAVRTKEFKTRYCVHLHPFLQTCYSEMDTLLKMARLIVPAQFSALAASQPADRRKYCIELVRRGHHSQMDRDTIIRDIAAMVPTDAGFSVDLKHADIVLLVEILGRTTGISVLSKYHALHKLNIRTLFEVATGLKQEAEAKESPAGEGRNKKRKQEQEAAAAAAAAAATAGQTPATDGEQSAKRPRTTDAEAAAADGSS